jgi:DNA-binding NarL/FixJ family response regulator
MLNKLIPLKKDRYKHLNVLIVEPSRNRGHFLTKLIAQARPHHKVLLIDNLEQVFSLIYGEVTLDIIFFDIDTEPNIDNVALIKAISPQIGLIHWSRCQHPEVIELLYSLGVKSFCYKTSNPEIIIEAMDLAGNYPKCLYLDKQLNGCLSLL